jgi:tetratricopeptide (TPR) repeat protein
MRKFPFLWVARLGILGSLAGGLLPGVMPVVAQPQSRVLVSQANARAYYQRGIAALNAGDWQGAIANLSQAIRLDPRIDNAYVYRGAAKYSTGDYQGAITDINQALAINPRSELAYVSRGMARRAMGDYQGAVADYNQALSINSKSDNAYACQGEVRFFLGEYQGAMADANQAIRINPKNSNGYYARGLAQFGLRNDAAARADFNEALQLYPNHGGSLYWLGKIKLRQGNYQGAIADYNRAVRLFPAVASAKGFDDYSITARRQLNTPIAAQPTTPRPQPATAPVSSAPAPPPVNTTPASVDVYKLANQTTVRIDGQNPGSGVIISRSGNTYYVLTAKHVVATPDEYEVLTSGGQKFRVDYSQVKKFANLDLAVIQFTSSENIPVAQLGNSEQMAQGENVFVSGWPIIDGSSNHQVTDGRITGFRKGDTNGYELTYNNATGSGMSGGPVFNARGQVIGIHGRGGGNEQGGKIGINLGMPIYLFLRQAPQAGLNVQQLGLKP